MFKQLLKLLILTYIMCVNFSSICSANGHNWLVIKNDISATKLNLKDENDKMSYALGASLGSYIKNSFKTQEHMGILLDNFKFIEGLKDSIAGNSKLNFQEISKLLKLLEFRLKIASDNILKKNFKKNYIAGRSYLDNFLKEKGVKRTNSGLLYLIRKKGAHNTFINNKSIFTVHYKGTLVNGIEFDNSYKRGKPFSFTLDSVIPGWREGIMLIGKGGKIKLGIPPHLAYGTTVISGIPINSTLVFEIEILNIKN